MSAPAVLTRAFAAPCSLVFSTWTEPEHLVRWWGTAGSTVHVIDADVREGGVFHYFTRSPAGAQVWGKLVYRDVVAPDRIVFLDTFSDQYGLPTRHPQIETWPLEVLTTVTLGEHGTGTMLKIEGTPWNAADEERATFEDRIESVRAGWGGTLDQLDRLLEQLRRVPPPW